MSDPDEKFETQAKNHWPAIIGIIGAILVAALAFMFLAPGDDEGDMAREAPAEAPMTSAEGISDPAPAAD